MLSSLKKRRPNPSAVNASAIGVAQVLSGPACDHIDAQEATSFLEAQLRCELLRAQIHAVKTSDDVTTRESRHRGLRINVVLACTIVIVLAAALSPNGAHPGLLTAMIAILAILSENTASICKSTETA